MGKFALAKHLQKQCLSASTYRIFFVQTPGHKLQNIVIIYKYITNQQKIKKQGNFLTPN